MHCLKIKHGMVSLDRLMRALLPSPMRGLPASVAGCPSPGCWPPCSPQPPAPSDPLLAGRAWHLPGSRVCGWAFPCRELHGCGRMEGGREPRGARGETLEGSSSALPDYRSNEKNKAKPSKQSARNYPSFSNFFFLPSLLFRIVLLF